MKILLTFLFSFLLTFNLFADEATKEVVEKTVANGVSGVEFIALIFGVIGLLIVIFFAAREAEKAHFPED